MSSALLDILKQTPIFSSMDEKTVQFFVTRSHIKSYQKGKQLFAMGDKAECFYIILDGWIKLYRITSEGEEAIIHVFGPGETFAEAAVFNERQRYPVNAEVAETAKVLEIPRVLFVNKIHEDGDFALSILGSIAARQHFLVQQIEQVTVKSAPQRIGTFLLKLCPKDSVRNIKINLPYDKGLVARRLNIQPETFSRALNKLKPHGVNVEGRQIIVKDVAALSIFCDVDSRDLPCE
jgi:CRP-like cAMP-binding protein